MSDDKTREENRRNREENKSSVKPDPETLHTTDPQKKMEGPVSSLIKKTGKGFNTDKSPREADEERDRNM